jgi:hypothetical protein
LSLWNSQAVPSRPGAKTVVATAGGAEFTQADLEKG